MEEARVGIIMGSVSDLETMRPAATTLAELGVPHEMRVVSAHRTPDLLFEYAAGAASRGLRIIIAGAGMGLMLVGILFKVSAAPFHVWTPDVYQGAPTNVTAFMASVTPSLNATRRSPGCIVIVDWS